MEFTYLKTSDKNLLGAVRRLNLYQGQNSISGEEYEFVYSNRAKIFQGDSNSLLAITGNISYNYDNSENALKRVSELLLNNKWPLPPELDGIYSGFFQVINQIYIFNDFIGPFNLYYSFKPGKLIITTQLSVFSKLKINELSKAGIFLEVLPREFISYGRLTVYKNVFRLLPGELLKINLDNGFSESFFDELERNSELFTEKELSEILVSKISRFHFNNYSGNNDIILPLSGGVDSRIILASLVSQGILPKQILSYGDTKSLDVVIPKKIAKDFNLKFDNYPIDNFQFPIRKTLYKIVEESDSLYVNAWLSFHEYCKSQSANSLMLIGDFSDVLRSKNIGKFKNRNFRTKYFIKKFLFDKKLEFTPLNSENLSEFKKVIFERIISKASIASRFLCFSDLETLEVKREIFSDLQLLFNRIDKFNLNDLESYEEIFGIFTHGRREMGKQLNIMKSSVTPDVPLMHSSLVKLHLSYHPSLRYSDNLTHHMFQNRDWSNFGNYPTAQNPFINYSSNYYSFLLGWFLRSKVDNFLTKAYIYTNGKTRLKKLYSFDDYGSFYSLRGAYENYQGSLSKATDNTFPLLLFKSRMKAQSWPISGKDLMPFVQASCYIDDFSDL